MITYDYIIFKWCFYTIAIYWAYQQILNGHHVQLICKKVTHSIPMH